MKIIWIFQFLAILTLSNAQQTTTTPSTSSSSSSEITNPPNNPSSISSEDEGVEIIITRFFDPESCLIDPPPTLNELDAYYQWLDDYNRTWNNAKERKCKMIRVIYNLRNIKKHNDGFRKGTETFERRLSFASDLTFDEKYEQYLMKNMRKFEWRSMPIPSQPFPPARTFVNYTAEGLVSTPVTDQGNCGSCYAFAANNALEGQVRKCGITYDRLSPQSIVDCATLGVWGCSSGWPYWSYRWMMSAGIMTEKTYPYTAKQGNCQYNRTNIVGYVDGAFTYENINATFMQQVVSAVGPVAVPLCVEDSFFSYASGVYKLKSCCTQLMHAVTIVGYGADPLKGKYWIVKNSWGSDWGDQGFFKISRGNNHCMIESQLAFPSVRKLNGDRCP